MRSKFAAILAHIDITFLLIMIIVLPILFITGYRSFFAETVSPNGEATSRFNTGWRFQWETSGLQGSLSLPGQAKGGKPGETLILTNTLPNGKLAYDTLFIKTSQQYLSILVRDHLLYTYGERLKKASVEIPGSAWHFVKIPAEYRGDRIEIRLTSPYPQYTGTLNSMEIGSKSALLFEILDTYSLNLVISGILMLSGLAEILLFLIVRRKKEIFDGAYLLGVFSLLAGIWIASESKIVHFFILSPILLLYIACTSLLVLPIPILQFVKKTYKPRDGWILQMFTRIFSIYFVIAALLQLTGLVPFLYSLVPFHILLGLSGLSLVFISSRELKTGNQSIRVFFFGCIVLAFFTILDLVSFYFSAQPWINAQNMMQFGILLFTLIMTVSLGKSILAVYEKQTRTEIYECLAYTDILTGLKNRTSFEEAIQDTNKRLSPDYSVSIVVFDINNLKDTNDTLGHKEGDQLIRNAAELIKGTFQPYGEIYKIGGDEFVAIITKSKEPFVRELLSIFAQKLEDFNHGEQHIQIGIAWGLSSYRKSDDKDLYSVLVRADKAMYECKRIQKHLPA